jgi:hypothetical protein
MAPSFVLRLTLAEDDGWTRRHYEPDERGDTDRSLSRQLFAGTLAQPRGKKANAARR